MSRPTPVGRIVIRPSDDTKAIIGITKGADPSLKPGMVYEIRKDDSGVMTLHEVGESCIRGPIKDEDTRQDAVFSWAHDLGLIFDAMGVQCVATLKEPKHIENIEGILEEQQHYRFMNMRQLGYAGSPVIEFFFPRFEAPRSRPKDVEQKLTEMFDILAADPEAALKMGDAIKEKYANIPELSKAEVMIWKRRALAADDTQEDTATTTEPIKGDTAPMSQPITEQDVADYLEKFIQTSELVPDQMKALFIGRVTNWGNPVGAQPVAQDGTAAPAASAEVSRMGDAGTCGVSVIKEADNTFSIVIGDQKWPIANCGTIGHTIADGDEFQSAMKKVGEVNYRGFPGEFMLPTNAEMAYLNGIKEMAISRLTRLVAQCDKTSILACNIGKRLGRIVDEDDIQAIAARERLKLLNPESIPTAMTQMQKQERANFINSVAGFPRAPETK